MFDSLPQDAIEFSTWPWKKINPYFRELAERPIDAATVAAWIKDWDRLAELLSEAYQRLWVATTVDTNDEATAERYQQHLADVYPESQAASQVLKEKLLASGLEPAGFADPAAQYAPAGRDLPGREPAAAEPGARAEDRIR